MTSHLPPKDFEPSPSSCSGLDYIDIPATADMRYNQDSNPSSLAIEAPSQPPPILSLYQAPGLSQAASYSTDPGHFYNSSAQVFPALDVRPRLGSNTSVPTTGMATSHRPTTLSHPGYSAREIYSRSNPSYGRVSDHASRSPPFPGTSFRRHPLSPAPSPGIGFSSPVRMDSGHYGGGKAQTNIPPLGALQVNGKLEYAEGTPYAGTPIKVDINGLIDKGFFQSEGEWTCYRRNYFSCICSYNLTPHHPNVLIQYTPHGAQSHPFQVLGFAMSISAMVADTESNQIDLVQHTPKRDKGPTEKPTKQRMNPKPQQPVQHPMSLYGDHALGGPAQGMYNQSFGQGQNSYPTEYTFERIQFKQATANNGKRRAAQQYYHLVVELYADVGSQDADQFVKIAQRKSAKMIVRGRSPGHYQSERRGSTSSGPGGSGSGIGNYTTTPYQTGEYTTSGGSSLLPGGYGGYGSHYGTHRGHDLPMEPIMSAEEAKAIDNTKQYQYYPTALYEGTSDPRQGIEPFSHRNEQESLISPSPSASDQSNLRMKTEYEGGALPSLLYPGPSYYARGCNRFEGKSSSAGYYPTVNLQSGVTMT